MFRSLLTTWVLISSAFALAADPAASKIEQYIAIDNVCAWPNLTRLKDGTLIATIFNQPSHGAQAGDVECWASSDGRFWKLRSRPAVHEPDTNRMNVAVGLARNSDLIVIASGWSNIQQPGQPKQAPFRDAILRNWVCRSTDGGATWSVSREFPAAPEGLTNYIPFGDILPAADGSLRVTCYAADPTKQRGNHVWMFRSDNDGLTWNVQSLISNTHNETTILPLGNREWLAAARFRQTDLIRSLDDGQSWQPPVSVTKVNQINGHLTRLADGKILLTFGDRIAGQPGVQAQWSADGGQTWSQPLRLTRSIARDCGYPSSLEMPNGEIVTAHYSQSVEGHHRYHMGVAIWRLPQ